MNVDKLNEKIADIKALNGKVFALCTVQETELIKHFIRAGRKMGVDIRVGGKKPLTINEINQTKASTNDRVKVIFTLKP